MKACSRLAVVSLALFVWRGECRAGGGSAFVSGTIADYNVTSVRTANGALTVPATLNFKYTAGATIPIGTTFTVTLPAGFTFTSAITLTASNGTTTVTAIGDGGLGARSATFIIGVAPLLSGQTIAFSSFGILATPLETITPLASALSLTMQANGIDPLPLSLSAFASDPGIVAIFVGAIQFIDINPPSNGTQFLSSPDSYTAVVFAFAIQPQTLLSAAGTTFVLSPSDTATITVLGNFQGIVSAFVSSTSDCKTPIGYGTVNVGSISIPSVPFNTEKFGCVTGGGGVLPSNPNGFPTVTVSPGSSTDFASTNALVEFPGFICYSSGSSCVVGYVPPAVGTPTLSGWAMYGLAGIMLTFGIWRLRSSPAA
jgi:hypothetical protein